MTYTYSAGQLVITVSPDYGTAGNYAYNFVATDQYNASREMSLPVVVSHTNRAPEYIGSTEPMEHTASGEVVEYSIADYFSDPDGDTFTYTVATSDDAIAQVFASANNFLVKPLSVGETTITFTATDAHSAQSTQTVTVNVAPVLGIEESDVNFSLTAYPNPTKGKAYIHIDGEIANQYHIRVFNAMGATVLVKDTTRELDLSSLQKGVYFIEITDNAGRSTRRIVKD
jgi:hypothetical protein